MLSLLLKAFGCHSNKRLISTLYPKFFLVNMIFSKVQPLEYNKICMGFDPRVGAR